MPLFAKYVTIDRVQLEKLIQNYTNMNPIEQFLASIGLEPLESKLYITALSFGTVPASVLANKLEIPRSTARYTCEQLIRKKLMIETKRGNTKLFTAENPTKLASILYDEGMALKQKQNQLPLITSTLQKIYNPHTSIPDVTFYEGNDGVAKMLLDLSHMPGEIFTFSAGDYFATKSPELVKKFRQNAHQDMNRKIYVIRPKKYRELHEGKDKKCLYTQYFSHIDELKIDFQILEETISITSLSDNAPIGILIKHKEIAEEFQKIFKELWLRCEKER